MTRLVVFDFQSKTYKTSDKSYYKGKFCYLIDETGTPFDSFSVLEDGMAFVAKHNHNQLLGTERKKPSNWTFEWHGEFMSRLVPADKAGTGYKLNDSKVHEVNERLFVKAGSGLVIDTLLTGSNATGAYTNPKNSPLFISNGKYKGWFFTTGFGIMSDKKFSSRPSKERMDLNIEQISIEEYFKLFPKQLTYLKVGNAMDVEDSIETTHAYSRLGRFSSRKVYLEFTSNMLNVIKENLNQSKREGFIKSKVSNLRSMLRGRLISEIKTKDSPSFVSDDNNKLSLLDAAHIVSVEDIVKQNIENKLNFELDMSLISDPNNGLLVNKLLHKDFDDLNRKNKGVEYIDEDGAFLDTKIKDVYLTAKRKEIIQLYKKVRNSQ